MESTLYKREIAFRTKSTQHYPKYKFSTLLSIKLQITKSTMLEGKSLSCQRDGRIIFKGLNFKIEAGSVLSIQGPNGSGKSSLLRMLSGFIPINQGNIVFNDKSTNIDDDFRAQHIEYIGHTNAIKNHMSAWENLVFWTEMSENKVGGFDDFLKISDIRDKFGLKCSAGQLRRISLSRLSVSKKKIWVLDEPTTSLDTKSIKAFLSMLRNHCLIGGIAIIATHLKLDLPNINSSVITLSGKLKSINCLNDDPFLTGDW